MKTIYNDKGVPLLGLGERGMFFQTRGHGITPKTASKSAETERPDVSKQTQEIEDKGSLGKLEFIEWGDGNQFPTTANDIIRSVGVLNTGLKFIRNFTIGQGFFPCNVVDYNDDGSEVLKVIKDPKIISICQSRMVRRYLEKSLRDYLKYGCSPVQLLPDVSGKSVRGLHTINALNFRSSVPNKLGFPDKAIISGKWPDTPGDGEYEEIMMLDDYDPDMDFERLMLSGKFKKNGVIYLVKDSWSNDDFYSEPIWHSAYLAGWIDVAQSVPTFLKKAYENAITWKWHVQIPYAFFDKKFPTGDYASTDARKLAIDSYLDAVEENLCGVQNASKPLITFYEINPQTLKAEEKWVIEALSNKNGEAEKLITSAAANSEILFSLMLNPNVLGAGMPGGTYAGNQGGSNIREAFLVNIANSWVDRQNILDPIELLLRTNGAQDVQLRFRSTILTTLDTGAGTSKTLS